MLLGGGEGVESDEDVAAGIAGERFDGEGSFELGLGKVVGGAAAAFEGLRPTLEGAGVGTDASGAETGFAAIGAKAGVGVGGQLSEGVGRAQADALGIGGDEVAPEDMLLGAVEKELGGVAIDQKVVPEVGGPSVPGEDGGGFPMGEA